MGFWAIVSKFAGQIYAKMKPLQAEDGIIWMERSESTNSELRRHIDSLDNLSVIAAMEQTAGRGQGDHSWFSSPRTNLTFSLLLRIGRFPVPPVELVKILLSRILPIDQDWTAQAESVVFNIRLPRIIAASLIGAGLSLSGLIFQIIFRNPLVSPDVLGTSTGAGFGAALALLWTLPSFTVPLFAFTTGLLAVFLVWCVATRVPSNQVLGLVLGGIMISSLFQSGTSFIKLVADPEDELPAITYFLMGSLSGAGMDEVKLLLPPMIISIIPMLMLSWRMNILSLPEEEALSLGVNTKVLRGIAIIAATLLMTASSVAVAGVIGWVGLVIPHITRMLVGQDARETIPSSIILGAAFLTAVDTISRSAAYSEIPIGILTSFIGAPFFLYLIIKEGKKSAA